MNIIVRADANSSVGIGHIMRCLSIADAAMGKGYIVQFIIADKGMEGLISARGYESIVLGSDYRNLEDELSKWPALSADIVIVDSYYVTAKYLKDLKTNICGLRGKVIYIDDVLSFPYPCDILINYSAHANKEEYEKLYGCLFEGAQGVYKAKRIEYPLVLLGVRFTPLRDIFIGIGEKTQKTVVKNILVSTGGSDELHVTKALINVMDTENRINGIVDVKFHLLIGAANKDRDEICEMVSERNEIVIHENVSDMKKLISSMDIVVSAAGSTMYEVCACGVPLITYVIADNQVAGATAFEKLGIAINIGDLRDPESIDDRVVMSGKVLQSAVRRIIIAIKELIEDYELRCEMGSKMQWLVDGYGSQRIIREIEK